MPCNYSTILLLSCLPYPILAALLIDISDLSICLSLCVSPPALILYTAPLPVPVPVPIWWVVEKQELFSSLEVGSVLGSGAPHSCRCRPIWQTTFRPKTLLDGPARLRRPLDVRRPRPTMCSHHPWDPNPFGNPPTVPWRGGCGEQQTVLSHDWAGAMQSCVTNYALRHSRDGPRTHLAQTAILQSQGSDQLPSSASCVQLRGPLIPRCARRKGSA